MSKMDAARTEAPVSKPQQNCYLRIWGEPSPQLSPGYGLASLPPGDRTEIHIYEYFWTLGMFRREAEPGAEKEPGDIGWLARAFRRHDSEPKMEAVLPGSYDGFAQVRLFFPRGHGFWVHEIAVSVKLLSPPPLDFAEKVGKDLTAVQPLMGLAGDAVAAVGAVGGPVVSAAGHVLGAVAKVKMNDVPSTKKFPWSVQQFSARSGSEEWDGVVWNLPGDMFKLCGDRVTGSIAVVFLPTAPGDEPTPTPTLEIRGQASFGQQPSAPLPPVDCSFQISPSPGTSAS